MVIVGGKHHDDGGCQFRTNGDLLHQLKTTHAGHSMVDQQQGKRLMLRHSLVQQPESFTAGFRQGRQHSPSAYNMLQNFAAEAMVIHNQHFCAAQLAWKFIGQAGSRSDHEFCGEIKCGPMAILAFQPQLPTHKMNDA